MIRSNKMYATIVKKENGTTAIYLNGSKEYSSLHSTLESFTDELIHLIDLGFNIRIRY